MSSENKSVTGETLTRGLESRHIQLIAIGGAIGVGLFLGSSTAIRTAGPGLLLSYLIGAAVIFFVMRPWVKWLLPILCPVRSAPMRTCLWARVWAI